MNTLNKNVHKTDDEITDITFYVMVGGLVLGFILTLGYLIYTFFE